MTESAGEAKEETLESFLSTEKVKHPDCSFSVYSSKSCQTDSDGNTSCQNIERLFRQCRGEKVPNQVFSKQSKSLVPTQESGTVFGDQGTDTMKPFNSADPRLQEIESIFGEFEKFGFDIPFRKFARDRNNGNTREPIFRIPFGGLPKTEERVIPPHIPSQERNTMNQENKSERPKTVLI
mmetsp:Transcript_20779/g.24566  ORF Transcript_20779/g.24566 Transcript_20779/m.24566 type:complete len:180 (-) Transcript_20779:197-736(-)|eukprot:CAMPEP_0114359826 /NCGR_PEP_ID=MMETSP0101-20121206/23319_1 /TAXON_ID=38822 ORGANISM="Pteridomonas danica, Strain PT" /NCGR_SAMPLE_ID=MMETSP0101 /ASSEMBLY_ACC=CAM_ASM_000211 /LENGTH=179 /DNA_ID=CAMNT_0001503585 /DNA_START=63 /DNA_END=602 /DNA_ORIENTATION=-